MPVVDNSAVPVGAADKVREDTKEHFDFRGVKSASDFVSIPELLKEGAAVKNIMRPEWIVVGSGIDRAREILRLLAALFSREQGRITFMGMCDVEMTQYVT